MNYLWEIFEKLEFSDLEFFVFSAYLPLGFIGIWRWSIWLIKKFFGLFYRTPPGEFNEGLSLSIITPVYNEDPCMFLKALNSWAKNKPSEIIAVIDWTDKKCQRVFKKFQKKNNIARLIITKEPGKREALAKRVKEAQGKIIALIDSDTIWSKNIKEGLLAPFSDPLVGGVGPRQEVIKMDTLSRKLYGIRLFERFNNELKFLGALKSGLPCLSGRTAVYRKEAIKDLMEDMVKETFMGEKCISGDDKCLTHLVMKHGWKLKYLHNLVVFTPGASTFFEYIKQQIRWTRNSWRADLKAVTSSWIKREPVLLLVTLDRFVQPFTILLSPIFFIYSLLNGHFFIVTLLLVWWFASRSLKFFGLLIKNPSTILIVPLYILFTFFMGVVRIYTLFTVKRQSWITRWDASRLLKITFIKELIPYFATITTILLLSSLVFFFNNLNTIQARNGKLLFSDQKKSQAKEEKIKEEEKEKGKSEYLTMERFNLKKEELIYKIHSEPYAYYQARSKDTLLRIKQKFNLPNDTVIYDENKKPLLIAGLLPVGKRIAIPIPSLRHPLQKKEIIQQSPYIRPQISYDQDKNIITIKESGSVITIDQLSKRLTNKKLLENTKDKEWILRASIDINPGVTLIIDGETVSWLKMQSEPENFSWIRSGDGNILIENTKITSWDEEQQNFDLDPEKGRAYILQKNNGRMDIINSELAYLGYLGWPKRGAPFGGPYGVSWKINNGAIHSRLNTGVVLNSKFHHNYFGIYTYGATGILFRNNEVYQNISYGFDPHDDSNNLIIENNLVYENGRHGIITSKRCYSNIIRNNTSVRNKLHGVMLDKASNYNLVENNFLAYNNDGIAINEASESNLIINNQIENNKHGIRVNAQSKNNYFENNVFTANQKGFLFYNKGTENYIASNIWKNNSLAIDLKEGTKNFFLPSLVSLVDEWKTKKLQSSAEKKKENKELQNTELSEKEKGDDDEMPD